MIQESLNFTSTKQEESKPRKKRTSVQDIVYIIICDNDGLLESGIVTKLILDFEITALGSSVSKYCRNLQTLGKVIGIKVEGKLYKRWYKNNGQQE